MISVINVFIGVICVDVPLAFVLRTIWAEKVVLLRVVGCSEDIISIFGLNLNLKGWPSVVKSLRVVEPETNVVVLLFCLRIF